ncbi:hypothetical protein [Escherichia coli]
MMKMKTGMVALSVMLYCSIPAMADLLSLPKLNDSTFGYGKSVDGAVSS